MRRLLLLLVLLCWAAAPRAAPPTPLEYGVAVEAGNTQAVRTWLEEGLPVDFMADRIGSGLMIAAWTGNLELMRLFLDRGADVHLVNRYDEQALQLAAWRGHLEAVRLLLEHGAAVNRGEGRWGALHYAVFAGHGEIVRLLMEKGAAIDARTPNGSTALMLAAREGHGELVRLLLGAGADRKARNEWGDDALAFAMRYRHYGIAKMVSASDEFAAAVRKPPQAFGAPVKSVPAPPEIGTIVEKLRQAQAAGRPTEELQRALAAALALHRHDSELMTVQTRQGRGGRPEVLVITAKRNEAGRERAELLYEAIRAGAAVTTPAQATRAAESSSEISTLLERLQREKGRKGRAAEQLRRQLHEAVARFRREAEAEARAAE